MAFPIDATAAGNGAATWTGGGYPIIFAGELLEKFYSATVLSQIANTKYEGQIKSMGDTVRIRTCPDVTIGTYEKGKGLSYEWLNPDYVDLLIDKGKYYGFLVNRIDEIQSDMNFLSDWTDDAGMQLKVAVDASVLDGIPTLADTYNKGATAGAKSGNINLGAVSAPVSLSKTTIVDKVVEMGQVLDEQNIPDNDRWLVLPSWACTRIKTSELKDASLSGDGKSMLRNGRIGQLDRFTIYQSNQLKTVTDGSDHPWYIQAGHKSALTFASQLLENELIPNQNDFGKIMRGLQVYGWKVIQPKSLVTLYAKAA